MEILWTQLLVHLQSEEFYPFHFLELQLKQRIPKSKADTEIYNFKFMAETDKLIYYSITIFIALTIYSKVKKRKNNH